MNETQHRWYHFIARNSDFIVPFVIGALGGAFGAVLFSAVSHSGIPLTFYLGAITAIAAACISVFSAWALATRTDAIQRRREANLARLHIRALRQEWELIYVLLGTLKDGVWTDDQIKRGVNILRIMSKSAEDVPSFTGILDNEQDIEHAKLVKDIFAFTLRRYSLPADTRNPRSFVEKRFRDRYGPVWVGMQVDGLRAAESHFAEKAGS